MELMRRSSLHPADLDEGNYGPSSGVSSVSAVYFAARLVESLMRMVRRTSSHLDGGKDWQRRRKRGKEKLGWPGRSIGYKVNVLVQPVLEDAGSSLSIVSLYLILTISCAFIARGTG